LIRGQKSFLRLRRSRTLPGAHRSVKWTG